MSRPLRWFRPIRRSEPGIFAITGLSTYASADNTFSASAPYVTSSGLSFSTPAGDYNLADLEGYGGYTASGCFRRRSTRAARAWPIRSMTVSLVVRAVPEPGNITLMLAGAVGLAGLARRRAAR